MSENPIALRSKKKLVDALEELIHEKPYRDITITELCTRAKLSRPAFYQNFGRIDDVMRRLVYEKVKATANGMDLSEDLSSRELAETYFQILNENLELMKILVDNDLSGIIIEMCTSVFMEMPQSYGNLADCEDYDTQRFYSAFVSAGAATVLSSWLVKENSLCEEDVIAIIQMALEGRPFRDDQRF